MTSLIRTRVVHLSIEACHCPPAFEEIDLRGRPRLVARHRAVADAGAAHGDDEFAAALERAVAFFRWRPADVRSILAAGPGTADPRPAGDALILDLPAVPVRPLADYAIGGLS